MITIEHLSKTYTVAQTKVEALRDVNIEIPQGCIYGIIGMSGAGKSTLVRLISMLERPTSGRIIMDGQDLTTLDEHAAIALKHSLGMIFQNFNLLMQKNVYQNIALPMELMKKSKGEIDLRVEELLEVVSLADKAKAYPSQLSGGQKQRVAIARALANNPKVLLCDEPTSALDNMTTNEVLRLLKKINQTMGVTIVIITHEMRVVHAICDAVSVFNEGVVVETGKVDEVLSHPKEEFTKMLINGGGWEL